MTPIQKELIQVQRQNDGLLRPEDVVAFAADPETALHSRFTWDDDDAGHQWRLQQARQLIRVTVSTLPRIEREVRAFVSLKSDRYQTGGGYRRIEAVLKNASQREQLLAEALEELERWQAKYEQLQELAEVFAAIKSAKGKKLALAGT